MQQEQYLAEREWLQSYFDYCEDIDIDANAATEMAHWGITLPEILHVFRSPVVEWAERYRDRCVFCITGRNCDEEKITLYGGFASETQFVSVTSVMKD